jgi:hypothetical protein
MNHKDVYQNLKFKDLILDGIDGNIVLIGFPHDLGARLSGRNFGQEYGPGISFIDY